MQSAARIRRLFRCGGVAAVVALLASAEPARAFYWYGWPGSRLPPDKTVVTPPHKDKPGNPPDRPPVMPPPDTENPPPPSNPTPEPASGLAALLGLGTLAAARRWRHRRAQDAAQA